MEPTPPPLSAFAMRRARDKENSTRVGFSDPPADQNIGHLTASVYSDHENEASDYVSDFELPSNPDPLSTLADAEFEGAVVSTGDPSATKETFTLKEGECMTVLGCFRIRVLRGVVFLYGAILKPGSGSHVVLPPSPSCYPVLHCLSGPADITLEHCTEHAESHHAMLCQSPFDSLGLSKNPAHERHTFVTVKLFEPKSRRTPIPTSLVAVRPVAKGDWSRFLGRQLSPWTSECETIFNAGADQRRVAYISGQVRGGSALFTVLLINHLISRAGPPGQGHTVGVLNLDHQNPILGPPGQISLSAIQAPLLGTPFGHPMSTPENQIVKAHAISIDGYEPDPQHFVSCVKELLQVYDALQKATPQYLRRLIVYCPCVADYGIDKPKSLKMAKLLLESRQFMPIDLITIGSNPDFLHDMDTAGATVLPGIPYAQDYGYSTRRLHDLQMLSYFHASLSSNGEIEWDNEFLRDHTAYALSWDQPDQDFMGVFFFTDVPFMYEHMLTHQLMHMHRLVQIIVIHGPTSEQLSSQAVLRGEGDDIPYFPSDTRCKNQPFDPTSSECIGVAFVQNIDVKNKLLRLITPIPVSVMASLPRNRTVLAIGAFEAPEWVEEEREFWAKQEDQSTISDSEVRRWLGIAEDDEEVDGRRLTCEDVMNTTDDERSKLMMSIKTPRRLYY